LRGAWVPRAIVEGDLINGRFGVTMAKSRKVARSQPARRPSRSRPEPDAVSTAQRVATLLGRDPTQPERQVWSPRVLPPLPSGQVLLETAGEALRRMMPPVSGASRSLAGCYALGYGFLGMASQGEAPDVPYWLRRIEIPIDPLDVLFFGACWPGKLRDPVEFGHARDAWLECLAGTRHGHEVARLVAAGVATSEELQLPLDDGDLLQALALRMDQAGIGTQPLATRLMPARALDGLRAVYGPPATTEIPALPPDSAAQLERYVALMGSGLEPDGTVGDALRTGLTRLTAGLLTGAVALEDLAGASGPMHDADDDPSESGDAARSADAATRIDLALETLDHPHQAVAAAPAAAIDLMHQLPGVVLLPALRLGLAGGGAPAGQAVHEAYSWAMGLSAGSPMIRLTDILLIASTTLEVSAADLLARILPLDDLTAAIPPADREFRGRTGVAFVRLALAAGANQVLATATQTVRRLDPAGTALLRSQVTAFEEKFGRPPRPDETIYFDPDAETPRPLTAHRFMEAQRRILEGMGLDELTIRAAEIAEMSPPLTGRFPDPAQQRDWESAVETAIDELNPDEDPAEILAADLHRLAWVALGHQITLAAEQPVHGHALVQTLHELATHLDHTVTRIPDATPGEIGSHAIAEILAHDATTFIQDRPTDEATRRARELAKVWGTTALIADVNRLTNSWPPPGNTLPWIDTPAALCLVAGAILTS